VSARLDASGLLFARIRTILADLRKKSDLLAELTEQGKAQLDLNQLLEDAKPSENPPLRVIQPFLDDQIREIRRSLNYYQSQQTESGQSNPVTKLILCGGGAGLQGFGGYVEQKLAAQGKTCAESGLEEMDGLWDEAKMSEGENSTQRR